MLFRSRDTLQSISLIITSTIWRSHVVCLLAGNTILPDMPTLETEQKEGVLAVPSAATLLLVKCQVNMLVL